MRQLTAICLLATASISVSAQTFNVPAFEHPLPAANIAFQLDTDANMRSVLLPELVCLPAAAGKPVGVSAVIGDANGFSGEGPMVVPDGTCFRVTYRLTKTCSSTDIACLNSRPRAALVPSYQTTTTDIPVSMIVPGSGPRQTPICDPFSMAIAPVCSSNGQRLRSVDAQGPAPVQLQGTVQGQCVNLIAHWPSGTSNSRQILPFPILYICNPIPVQLNLRATFDNIQ